MNPGDAGRKTINLCVRLRLASAPLPSKRDDCPPSMPPVDSTKNPQAGINERLTGDYQQPGITIVSPDPPFSYSELALSNILETRYQSLRVRL